MARLYDAIEPEVVSMDMLQRAVESLRADADNLVPKSEKLDYSEVDTIRLDFRSETSFFLLSLIKKTFRSVQIFFEWKIFGYWQI